MYGNVAEGAGLILLRLVVEARCSGRAGRRRLGMATDAQEIHLVLHQQPLIRRTMRRVANGATLDFRLVLVDKRPLLLAVALVADRVSGRVGAQLLRAVRAVRAVAIVALDQTLGDAMMKRPRELRPDILMAAIAKFRGLRLHQKLALLGMVRGVAVDAGDAIGQVHGTIVVAVFFGILMAA